ncbi:MAG: hypothetical protein HC853_15480 [Anaerolineae bacterium]|nr:hypothetical protein [Anaerolineae bacterium]
MQDLSNEFPIVQSQHYLNTASQGPWPARTAAAVQQFAARAQTPATTAAKAAQPL